MSPRPTVIGLTLLFVAAIITPPACFPQAHVQAAPGSSASISQIIPPPPSYHFPDGERFVYSVEWHMFNAGTATILLQRSASGEHLISTADSAGMVNKMFPVHDVFQAEIDPRTFCTSDISKHAEEGSRRLDRRVRFDYSQSKSQVDEHDLKTGDLKHAEYDIPPCVTDVVSGFFYASSLRLQPGLSQIFPVNDRGKTTDVRIEVESRERVKVPSGEFETLRVKAEPLSGAMKAKGVLWVWFSDDERHVPVQMKSKLGYGTLLFKLQRIETQPVEK
jgi:hypothetical protein